MSVTRVHRLIRLITLLQGHAVRSADELTIALGVSRRTLFRDLKMLEAAGVPYYHQRGRGYRIRQDFFLPPVQMTAVEMMGLLVLAKTAEADPARPLAPAAISAIHKLVASLPEPMRDACRDLTAAVSVDPGPWVDGDRENRRYFELQTCIDRRVHCEFVYRSPSDPEPMRGVMAPLALHLAGHAWYVLGTTSLHGDEVRMFKLVRFESVHATSQRFTRAKPYSPTEKLGLAWRLNPEGQVHDIELEFEPMVAQNVAEVRWHPTQKVEHRPDGRCRVRYRVDGIREIAWWLCGYANQCRVIKPVALRDLVISMHEKAAAFQQKNTAN